MTYKAGDKVVVDVEGKSEILTYDRMYKDRYVFQEYPFFSFRADSIRPATPVEIAKQAVLDGKDSEHLNELLDVLISKAEYNGALKIGATIIKDDNWNVTPPIIGDETKLD